MTARTPFVRRHDDRSQALRRACQAAFLLLNLRIGAQFYLFVRYAETGGLGPRVARPPGVGGWLPIAGLMNLKLWIVTGRAPDIHPAGLFLLVGMAAIGVVVVVVARLTGHWDTLLPDHIHLALVPRAGDVGHPGM